MDSTNEFLPRADQRSEILGDLDTSVMSEIDEVENSNDSSDTKVAEKDDADKTTHKNKPYTNDSEDIPMIDTSATSASSFLRSPLRSVNKPSTITIQDSPVPTSPLKAKFAKLSQGYQNFEVDIKPTKSKEGYIHGPIKRDGMGGENPATEFFAPKPLGSTSATNTNSGNNSPALPSEQQQQVASGATTSTPKSAALPVNNLPLSPFSNHSSLNASDANETFNNTSLNGIFTFGRKIINEPSMERVDEAPFSPVEEKTSNARLPALPFLAAKSSSTESTGPASASSSLSASKYGHKVDELKKKFDPKKGLVLGNTIDYNKKDFGKATSSFEFAFQPTTRYQSPYAAKREQAVTNIRRYDDPHPTKKPAHCEIVSGPTFKQSVDYWQDRERAFPSSELVDAATQIFKGPTKRENPKSGGNLLYSSTQHLSSSRNDTTSPSPKISKYFDHPPQTAMEQARKLVSFAEDSDAEPGNQTSMNTAINSSWRKDQIYGQQQQQVASGATTSTPKSAALPGNNLPLSPFSNHSSLNASYANETVNKEVVDGLENMNRKRKRIGEHIQPGNHHKDIPKRPRCDPQVFYEYYRRMRDGKTSETDLLQALETIYATYRSLEWRTERGETLLHRAIRLNHYDLARWMLDKIGDINAADNGGSTYLFDSIKNTDASFEIFKRLLEIPGIEVNKYTDAWPNLTPLKQCAESDGLLRFLNLLCKHPRINIRSIGFTKDRKCKRQNVLHHAAGYGSVETIKYLLQLNVTKKKSETNLIAVLDDNGRTPLVYALESEQWEAAKLLIQHMKTVDLKAGIPALTVAKHCGNEEIYQLIDAKIPKETPPPPPPKKAEPVKSSALEYMKSTVCNFGLLPPPASTIMPPPQTYGNQQYYQNQSPPMMLTQQQPSPVIVQQPQPLPPQMQYPQPQVQLPNSQASSIISPQQRQPPPMIATQPQQQQQLPPPVQHLQQQIQIPASAQPMVQYTPPSTTIPTTATLPQYVQQQQYFVNMEVSTSPARQQQRSQLSRMLSQPVIAQVPQQQRQQQLQYQNQYASMQSIPSSSTGHFVAPQMPQQRIPQQQQQQHPLQQQWQQNTTEYSQPITAPSNYTNYPQFNNFVVPVERRQPQPLKRAQSHAVLSTIPQYYQEVQPQQLQQQYYPPNNAVTNYSNQQHQPTMQPPQ